MAKRKPANSKARSKAQPVRPLAGGRRPAGSAAQRSLRALLEHAPIVLWGVDAKGVFTHVEGAGMARVRLSAAEHVGRSIFELYADHPTLPGHIRRALTGEAHAGAVSLPEGSWETQYLPVRGPRGRVRGVVGISVDVTARERARAEADRTGKRLSLIYQRSPVGIIAWDMQFCVRQWNPAAAAIFGISEKDAMGMHASRIVPREARPLVEGVWGELTHAGGGGGERSRNQNLTGDGRTITCEWHNAVLKDDDGRVTGVVSMVQDVTAEATAQAELAKRDHELRETSALLNSILDHAPAPIYVTDRDNRYQLVNKAWERFAGFTRERAVGRRVAELFPKDVAERVAALNEAIHATGRPEAAEQLMVGADRDERWFYTVKFPLRDADGCSRALGGISFDVTEKKLAEAELARHHERLEQEVRARTQELSIQAQKLRQSERLAALGTLAAGLGHDINNVLLPMRCWVDSLRSQTSAIGPRVVSELSSLTQSLNFLGQLSRSLLTLAASTDDMVRASARTSVPEWWAQSEAMLRGALPHAVDLATEIEPGLARLPIAADQLTRAALNLLVNAAEATGPDGRVRLFARREGDGVVLGVRDNGPGMSAEVRTHALDPFYTTKKRALSTGLGLSLVHAVIKASGGSLRIDSEPGRGTTVAMLFPASKAADSPSRKTAQSQAAWVSVEDEHTAGYLLALLGARGFRAARLEGPTAPEGGAVWVTDGAQLELARRLAARDRLPWTIVVGPAGPEWQALGARVVSDQTDIEAIAGALP